MTCSCYFAQLKKYVLSITAKGKNRRKYITKYLPRCLLMVLLHSWSAPWEKIIEYFQYRYKKSKENITLVKQYAVCDIDKYLKKNTFHNHYLLRYMYSTVDTRKHYKHGKINIGDRSNWIQFQSRFFITNKWKEAAIFVELSLTTKEKYLKYLYYKTWLCLNTVNYSLYSLGGLLVSRFFEIRCTKLLSYKALH